MPAAKRQPVYDAAAFPQFAFGHVLPPKVPPELRAMPELRSSLANAIYMASQIELAQGSVHLRAEPVRAAYLRASLAEIVRVEDVSKLYDKSFSFKQSRDPLLHAVKLLRNYEVHVGGFSVSEGAVSVNWGIDEAVYESYVVENLSAPEIRKLESAAGYSDSQLEELLALFDIHQRKFGVVQLIYNTALHVATLLGKA